MEGALDPVSPSALARLHRISIEEPGEVVRFLRRVQDAQVRLTNGINRRNDSRIAVIQSIGAADVTLRFENLDETHFPQLFLSCELGGRRYFFAVAPLEHDARGVVVRAALPEAIYQAERRDLERVSERETSRDGARVEICAGDGTVFSGVVSDTCYHGLGVLLSASREEAPEGRVTVRFLSGAREGERAHGLVRHKSVTQARQGWVKIGLAVSDVPLGEPVAFEQRDRILDINRASRLAHHASLLRGLARAASGRAMRRLGAGPKARAPHVIAYESAPGEEIRAIVDSWGDPRGAIAIVIPPAWGRTKETLSPLAATLVETFRAVNQPITVIRFDGTNRRGESFIPADLRHAGAEYLRFTFSGAVRDIHATFEFLKRSPVFSPRSIALVTLSLAAVEGRRAVATDPTGLLAGWISVVGMVDLQSSLRTISGGIDFAYGLSRGIRFGHHELVGVVADMDHTGLDALKHKLVFLEDARRDMARIKTPVTWIHGRHDAWMDVDRVRHLMSCGDTSSRRVIEVPTGHQLRTSAEAFSVFGLIAREVARMTLDKDLVPRLPDLAAVDAQREAERARLPKIPLALHEFWKNYLLGRDARLGFQLLTATSAYRRFMQSQIDALNLAPGARVLDLGAGTGDFAVQFATDRRSDKIRIDAVDFVAEALARASARLAALHTSHQVRMNPVLVNLDARNGGFPFRLDSYDAVLASLVVSYVSDPKVLLERVRSVLKPGGRMVLSTLRRDADISKLHMEGLAELRAGLAQHEFGKDASESIDELSRSFLNDASRILDLEEEGTFRFWDHEELAALARSAGWRVERAFLALGEPPQATVLVAIRS